MKLMDIESMARNNEFGTFFKQLYKHSIQVMESIPDDVMTEILSKSRSVTEVYGNSGSSYHLGVVDGFIFQNKREYDDEDNYVRCVDNRITMVVDVMYRFESDTPKAYMSLDMEESFDFDSCFDYRLLSMKLYLGRNEVAFYKDDVESDVSVEDKVFLQALCHQDFLERIFGKYLIGEVCEGDTEPWFYVSTKFFED